MSTLPFIAMKRPVLAASVGLASGMMVDSLAPVVPWPAYAAGSAVALTLLFGARRVPPLPAASLFGLFFFGGAAYWNAWHAGPPGDAFARDVASLPERTSYTMEGRVRAADVWLPQSSYFTATIDVDHAEREGESVALEGGVLVRWTEPAFPLYVGDRVRLEGVPGLSLGHVNPGTSGPEDHYRRRGVHTAVRITGDHGIDVIARAPWYDAWARLSYFRGLLATRLERAVPRESLPLVLTVWLGDRRQIDSDLYREFVQSGTAHVLAVSGLHVAIIFVSLRALLRMAVQRRRARLVLSLVSLVAVAGLTGAHVSTVRATIMISIYLVAEWFDREPDAPTALGIAGAIFLLQDPDMLYDVAFQLSFLSVASMLLFYRSLAESLNRLPMPIRDGVSATLAVQVLPLPVAAAVFHVVPPVAPLVNLVVIPLTGLLLWLGFLTSLCAVALPIVAPLFGHAVHPVAQAILGIARFVGASDHAHLEVTSPTPVALVAYGVAALLVYRFVRRETRRRGVWLLGALAALVLCGLVWSPVRPTPEVTVLDVGHGDAIFVRAPGGATMLVDTGLRSDYVDEGERTVAPFLWSNHESKLDVLMLTHPDADHMGGALYLLDHFRVGTVVLGPEPFDGTLEDQVVAVCGRKGIPVHRLARGDRFALGGADVEILHPPRDGTAVESENDRSLVARVSWPGMNVLLTGDIERAAETALAEAPGLADALRADVLKVPHHGSRTSSSEEFIDTVAPAVAVISVGPRGRRSVLSRDVVARYKSDGVTVLRTDVVGGVRFRTGPNGALRVEPARVMRGYVVRDEPGRVSHS